VAMSSPSTSVERSMIWSLAEGGTHTIGGFTHRSARKFILLDQDDIDDARLGEVVRDAGAPITPPPRNTTDALGKILAHVHVHFR
jgi:hypothetical protein